MKHISSFFTVFFIYTIMGYAQEKKNDPTRWTPEDIINIESLNSASFSEDGNMLVWTKRRPAEDKKKDKFVSDIYLTRLHKEKEGIPYTIQLTNKDENDHSPLFSKDGETIYFLSSRDKGEKLWELNIYGGEAKEVYTFKNGISNITWKDKNTLLYTSNDGKSLYEQELEEKKDNVQVIEDTLHWKSNRIYSFSLKDKQIKRITNNHKPVETYSISGDGKWLVYRQSVGISFATDATKDPVYILKNLQTGKTTQILKDLQFPSYDFSFDHGSKGFYFISSFANDPKWNGAGIEELYYYSLTSKTHQKISIDWDFGLDRGYHLIGDNILVSLANKTTSLLAYFEGKEGDLQKQEIDFGDKNDHVDVLATSKDGATIFYQYSTASAIPKYYVANLKKNKILKEKEAIKINEKLAKKSITKSEVMTWKGYNDDEVTGLLYYPENYETGKKYPLILSIHGGPAAATRDSWYEGWSTYPNTLSQRGTFVLKPNYHGSSNHGLSYVETIKGNYYEPEMEDITKGIQVLVDKGMVDKDKMGTMGWSNGAIITTMLTIRYPELFKFAAPGAGDVNWTSDFGTCRFGVSFDQSYVGGAPWDNTNGKPYNENYLIKSPLFELEKVKTPTIIFHGSEDRAVPRDQGWEYYRALQQIGATPVRFLWFPGQPHGLQKITHQLRKVTEELAWIDTYLFNKPSTKNEAFKEGSPLARLLNKEKVKNQEGKYGVVVNSVLIPEVTRIKKDSIAIGIFEVTNAQYKVFNSKHTYAVVKDNYPAIVTMNQAKSYTTWLSEKTGNTYRLPNTKEAKAFHKKALSIGAKENSLNYWAGYDITLDDALKLKSKIKELKHSLIEEVGKHKATKLGEASVYDLGGNVAEYLDNGKTYGFSAYDYVDPNHIEIISSTYTGFRVIKE